MAKKNNIEIPQKDYFEKWLPNHGVNKGSVSSYLSYIKNCIQTLQVDSDINDSQDNLKFDLLSKIHSFLNTGELNIFVNSINLASQLLSDNIESKKISGLYKYAEFLLDYKKSIKLEEKTIQVKNLVIIPVEEFRNQLEKRYNSDERYNSSGAWYPIKILAPILNSDTRTKYEFRTLKKALNDHFLIITEEGIAHLTAVSYFIAIKNKDSSQLYVKVVGNNNLLKVYYQQKCRLNPYKTHNESKANIIKEMTREHFIPMDWALSIKELKALNKVKEVLDKYKIKSYSDYNNNDCKNKIFEELSDIGARYILSDIIFVESFMTHTLLPFKQNSQSGAHKSTKKNKTSDSKHKR